jgi:hypothetical protein
MLRNIVLSTPIYSQNLVSAPSNIEIFFSLPRETGFALNFVSFELVVEDFYVVEFWLVFVFGWS